MVKVLKHPRAPCWFRPCRFELSSGHQDERPKPRRHPTKIIIRKSIPYLISIALACFLLYQSSNHIDYYNPISYRLFFGQSQNSTIQSNLSPTAAQRNLSSDSSLLNRNPPHGPSSPADQENEETGLENVLNKAAMENKTVIVTTINAAWAAPNSVFDLFLESLEIGNGTQKFLNHLVVIALDQKSYNRCLVLHSYCYTLITEGIDFSAHEAYFMTPDYVKLVWRKIEVMFTILKLGYDAIFTDADIIWLRDPFLHFLEDGDMQTASEYYWSSPTYGISNTGFYYVKSNSRTIKFFEFWLASRLKFKDQNDQDAFNMLRTNPALIENIGIKIRLLDTAFYGGFCESSEDLNLVCTMHANCCTGLGTKFHDLMLFLDDWKMYMASPPNDELGSTPYTWKFFRQCDIKI